MEQVSFNFARIDFEYRLQKPDGTLSSPVKAGWDVEKNKQV
jgi:type VI protein secretion system component Hcp